MDISQRISYFRETKGLSTTKLARMAGVAQSTLREIELGHTSPTWDTIEKLCVALKISPLELLSGTVFYEPAPEELIDVQRLAEVAQQLTPRQRKVVLEVMEEWAKR